MSIRKEFAILFGVLFLPGLIGQFGTTPANQFESVFYNIQILAVALPQIWLVAWFSELHTPGVQKRMGFVRPNVQDGAYGVLIAAALFLVSAAASTILSLVGVTGPGDGAGWSFSRPELLPLVLLTSILIGYREEVFYRAYLFTRAEELGATPAATLVGGAILFSVGHLYQGVGGLFVTALLGATLGGFYLRFRSLHAVALGHGLYNAAVLLLSGAGTGAG